jgi:alkylated DNA nucleotide flippase Atl1
MVGAVDEEGAETMNEELLFHVEGNVASRAERLSLADAGLREREHLQEWILANPDIIGEDILVITSEFDRWLPNAVSRSNRAIRDRLDILGLDATGQLVVAELKRDRAADTVEMQAIKYAAMVSQFTPDLLAQAFATHLSAQGEPTAHADARRALEDHAGGALDLKVLRRPRIVLIAGEFLDTTTTSAVWLTQMGVEVDLVRYQAYRTPGGLVVTTSKIWPLDEAEDLVVRPEEREEVEETQRERRRSRSVVVRLVEAGLIQDGAPMRFAIVPSQLSGALRDDVENWLAEDPQRGRATWVNSNPRCLRWELDGSEHSASGLVVRIVEQATGQRINVTGPLWWEDEEGNRLFEILEEHTGEQVYASGEHERDWSDLHALLHRLPPGRWTSYGDLAKVIGSSAIAVGQHVTSCPECPKAYRVLRNDGRVADNFIWDDPERDDDPRQLLQDEGVGFIGDHASPADRMTW